MIATSFPEYRESDARPRRGFHGRIDEHEPSSSPSTAPPRRGKGTLAKKTGGAFRLRPSGFRRALSPDRAGGAGQPRAIRRNEADAVKGAQTIDLSPRRRSRHPHRRGRQAASQVAAIPAVRQALLDFQRSFPRPPAGRQPRRGDGRARHRHGDLPGRHRQTVSSMPRPEMRAHRRWLELKGMGIRRGRGRICWPKSNARDAPTKSRADLAPEAGPGRRLARYLRFGYRRRVRGSSRPGLTQGRGRAQGPPQGLRRPGGLSGHPLTSSDNPIRPCASAWEVQRRTPFGMTRNLKDI